MEFAKWLDTLVDEKDLDVFESIEVTTVDGTLHLVELAVVLDFLKSSNQEEKDQVKKTLVQIDFKGGDIMHFFTYVAQFIADNT